MIWYMWWLAGLALVGIFATTIFHTFNYKRDFYIPVEDVIASEDARTRLLATQGA
jgi:cytochrome o ubiquinol oxidase subunit 1